MSRSGTARVTLVNRSQITRIYSYPSGVLGREPSKSVASAAKGSVAGSSLMNALLCVPMHPGGWALTGNGATGRCCCCRRARRRRGAAELSWWTRLPCVARLRERQQRGWQECRGLPPLRRRCQPAETRRAAGGAFAVPPPPPLPPPRVVFPYVGELIPTPGGIAAVC